jgi:hypothetical protein
MSENRPHFRKSCTIFEHAITNNPEGGRNSTTVRGLGVRFSTTGPDGVVDFSTRLWKSCAIFEHTFRNKPERASKSTIFRKPCPIFEHGSAFRCKKFDHPPCEDAPFRLLVTIGDRHSAISERECSELENTPSWRILRVRGLFEFALLI